MRLLSTSLAGLTAVILFLLVSTPSFSQCSTTGASSAKVVGGLISAPNLSGNITSNTGDCVVGTNQAAILSTNLPSYDDLESLYYTQAKASSTLNKANKVNGSVNSSTSLIPNSANSNPTLSLYSGDMTIDTVVNKPSGAQTQIVFIEGNLNINKNIVYDTTDPNYGLVFVVKGNVNIIDPDVTQIDAVIISSGIICTSYNSINSNCPNSLANRGSSVLSVNGSLISLNGSNPPVFRRNLNDNSVPAEQIQQQAKYLAILRNIMSQTLSISTEDTNYGPGN